MTHPELQSKILFNLGSRTDVRLWSNTVGLAKMVGTDHVTRVGLCPGSADLIGFRSRVVQPDDVGKRIAHFLVVEIKTGKDKPNKKQPAWLTMVESFGGIVRVARTEDVDV